MTFRHDGDTVNLNVQYVFTSEIYGFVELEGFIFSPSSAGVVVNPVEEKLREAFSGVRSTLIPISSVIRIDEVDDEEAAASSDQVKLVGIDGKASSWSQERSSEESDQSDQKV